METKLVSQQEVHKEQKQNYMQFSLITLIVRNAYWCRMSSDIEIKQLEVLNALLFSISHASAGYSKRV